jgi:predicted RNA-binding Zn-ribbon protein involved in translation (DUF1610 family)
LELDERERTEKKFTCPSCNVETEVEDLSSVEREELVGREKSIELQNAERDIRVGALWLFGGLAVTIVTYSLASEGGGHYVMAWGAIVFGGIQMLRGLFNSRSDESAETNESSASVECPNCKPVLELDESEVRNKRFQCPDCGAETRM